MANIYSFPDAPQIQAAGSTTTEVEGLSSAGGGGEMSRPAGVPDVVWDAVCSVRDMPRIPGVLYHEIPVDHELCDFGIGIEMMMSPGEYSTMGPMGSMAPMGWVSIQYAQAPQWQSDSHWLCVAFMRFPISSSEDDGLTPAMYWEEVGARMTGADPGSLSGTVSVTRSTEFPAESSPARASNGVGCEMRMSWTPATLDHGRIDAGMQVACLADVLRSVADGEGDVVGG